MNKLPVLNKTFDQIRSMFGFLSKLRYEQQHAASGSRKSRWGGSISESGGALAEMGAVKENEYFYKKDRELLRNLKTDINADIENHKIEIERKNEEIKQLQAKMKEIQNKGRLRILKEDIEALRRAHDENPFRSANQNEEHSSTSGGPNSIRTRTIPQVLQHKEDSTANLKEVVKAFTSDGIPLHDFRDEQFQQECTIIAFCWQATGWSCTSAFTFHLLGSCFVLKRLDFSVKISHEFNAAVKTVIAKTPAIRERLLDSKEYMQLVRQIKYLQNLIQSHNAEIAAVTKVIQDLSEAEKNYIRGRRHGCGYRQPMFPVNVWNCYDRTLAGLPSTTNPVKGWHHRLNLLTRKSHPSLTDFLQNLQNDVDLVSRQILRLDAGGSPEKRNTKYVEADKRITKILERYGDCNDNEDILGYSHLLRDFSIANLYRNRMDILVDQLPLLGNVEDEWLNMKQILTQAAKESLGQKKAWLRKKGLRQWDDDISKIIADKRQAYNKSLPSKETLRGHSDSSFRGEGYSQCCVGVRLCDMYSNQELAEIHFMYGKADGNAALARRLYQERYPQRQCPDRKTFGTTKIYNSRSIGGDSGGCEHDSFYQHTRVALQVNVPHTTVWRLLKEYQLYPYHLQRVQALSPADYPARVRFCQWFLQKCGVNPNFPALVLFTDEAQFTRDGITNFHNQHVGLWGYENPRATVPSHHQVRFSLNMWAGIIGDRLVGPHVLVNRLTGQAYTNFLENTIPHVLEDTPLINRQHIHFLHDGAPVHFSRTARRYFDRRFPDRWIDRGGPIAWPPRSPDLNPLDFYLWGSFKIIGLFVSGA
ncbi:hypothetical protein ANN_08618 [Periplaneta americana]|uniref:Uncharacterized protein n=1 Tax=Periplaneta americana TaxID=6978 RepID=A0ABQ8T3K6_PERAM|nr:hypothetical protein ANN_08618 [Periplaneta americana]